MMTDEEIEDLIVNTTAPLLKEIADLKRRVALLESIVSDVPSDVIVPPVE